MRTILLLSLILFTFSGCEALRSVVTDNTQAQRVSDTGEVLQDAAPLIPAPVGTIVGAVGILLGGWRSSQARMALKDLIENSTSDEVNNLEAKVKRSKTRDLIRKARLDQPGSLPSV